LITRIESSENARYKLLRKLAESSRERRKCQQTLLDGIHLVRASMDAGVRPDYLVLTEGASHQPEIVGLLSETAHLPVFLLTDGLFQKISPVDHASGILGVVGIPQDRVLESPDFCVMLEDIQDPGNLGAILRTAAAAGVAQAYLSRGCVDAWSPKVLRGGMGAHFQLNISENVDLGQVVSEFDGMTLATLPDVGSNVFQLDMNQPLALLLGNEGAGLSDDLARLTSHQVSIPMPGKMESLNVAAAAAVCLFEAVRQRQLG
jgi:TrmH family RNA methyltransferase